RPPLLRVAELALADVAVVVDRVGLAPERALPFARLLEEVAPGDRAVLGRVEAVVEGVAAHRVVEVLDEPAKQPGARERGEVALGDAEGHVGAVRIAPLGDDGAAPEDHAVRPAARPHGAEHVARRGGLVVYPDVPPGLGQEVAPPAGLVSAVIGDRGGETLGRHAELRRALRLPVVARGKVADVRYPTPTIDLGLRGRVPLSGSRAADRRQ